MNGLIRPILNTLRFFLNFNSVVTLIAIGVVMILFFTKGTSIFDGFGYSSSLNVLGIGVPIPFLVISTTYNSVFMVASLAVIMITFQFSEFLLFGHISNSVVGRIRNRATVIVSYITSLLILSLPLSLVFIGHYFAIARSIQITLILILISWMYTFALILMTTLVLNFNALRKFALFIMILLYLVGPATMMILTNSLKSLGGVWKIISYGTSELYSFLGLHFQLSRLIDFTISSSFFNWSELFGLLIYLIPYIAVIILVYHRKEFT